MVGRQVEEAPDTAPLVLGEFLPYRISVLAEDVSRLFAARYEAEFGLSIGEWRVLAVLGEVSPRSTQQVIEKTGMDRVRVSRAVIRLADKGFVNRVRHPEDARAQLLRPTARGRTVYRRIVPLARELQAALMGALTAEEQSRLDEMLVKLAASAAALAGPASDATRNVT